MASSIIQVGDQLASGPPNGLASGTKFVFSSAAELRSPRLRAAAGFSSGRLRSAFRPRDVFCFRASSNSAFQPTSRACHGLASGCIMVGERRGLWAVPFKRASQLNASTLAKPSDCDDI